MWIYETDTGRISQNANSIGQGYSGNGAGLNNPAMEMVPDVGPIPRGRWTIGPAYDHPILGPVTMDLTPDLGTVTYNRDLFRWHGDNAAMDYTASKGCIVSPRSIREQVSGSGDNVLEII